MFSRPRPALRSGGRDARAAASAVELALQLPLLTLLFLGTVDFARLFYHYSIVTNCARNGALYGSDPVAASESGYGSIQEAALADAGDLSPTPTVTSTDGTDPDGNAYVEVSVSYPFTTLTAYPGLPSPITLTRTVHMRIAPQ
jgi:Flp pilus assembly protein TadG